MTSSPHHLVNTCAAKSAPTHQIRILWGVGRWAGCVLVSIANELDRDHWITGSLEKSSRRDRDRVCAKFKRSRRFRGSNMNPKKKSRRCRGLGLDSGLDLAISRFIHSLVPNTDPGPDPVEQNQCGSMGSLGEHCFYDIMKKT